MSAGAGSSAKRKAPEPDSAAAAAAATRGASRAKRRQRARQRNHGDEFMDMNVEVNPDWGGPPAGKGSLASDRGAGALGFAGTAHRTGAATGLTRLAGDDFGSGPVTPMMPRTWDPSIADEATDDGRR
jgi:PPE-repeat protein